ncbi:MAG TPA: WecB/TagA/CpsF family glycosyltransferase [Verrucomicrobiae bacterium]
MELLLDRSQIDSDDSKASVAPSILPPPSITMLGVDFDPVSVLEALQRIEDMVASRRPHYVVTANVDFLVQARRDAELHRILLESDLVLCDGTPLVWVSRLLGNPLPERVAGSDLVPLLIERAAREHHRLFFLGGASEVAAQAVQRLQDKHPGIDVAGWYSPPFGPMLDMDHEEISRRIRAAKPDLLFVAFGCPKAEKWMAMHYRSLGVPVCMGIGATIDFLAGHMKRAPVWMQRGGLEWIYRLLQEPRRLFRRYAADLWQFGAAMAAQWWRMQLRGRICHHQLQLRSRLALSRAAFSPVHGQSDLGVARAVLVEPTWQRVEVPVRLDADAVRRDSALWEKIASDDRHALLEMANVDFIDSTGVGLLVRLHKRLRASGRFLVLLDPSVAVRRALKLMRLDDVFLTAPDAAEAQRLIQQREREQESPVELSPVAVYGASRPLFWRGAITAANAGEVWRVTHGQIKSCSSWRKQWDIDLADVRFIDSAGILLMARLKRYARRKGAVVRFTEAPEHLRKVVRLAGLENTLLGDEVARVRTRTRLPNATKTINDRKSPVRMRQAVAKRLALGAMTVAKLRETVAACNARPPNGRVAHGHQFEGAP